MKCSVILPTYNRGKKLIETVESIEKNDFDKREFEIIVVNDCSTDATESVIRDLKKKYKNILALKNKKNGGPATTRNNGIKKAKGKLIFFTDDDCLVPKNWLKTYASFFEKNSAVYGAGGLLVAKKENWVSKLEKIKDKILGIDHKKIKIGGREIKTGFTNNCVYREEIFKEVGYFDENFKVPAGEDLEFNQKVSNKHRVAFIPIKVFHNHKYNMDYFLGLVWKQSLGEMPPKKGKLVKLFPKIPKAILTIIKKVFRYRK